MAGLARHLRHPVPHDARCEVRLPELVAGHRIHCLEVAIECSIGPGPCPGRAPGWWWTEVARAHVRVPHAGIRRPEVDQSEFRIVTHPTPGRRPPIFHCWPRQLVTQVLALHPGIEWLETRADEHIAIRS